MRLPLRIGASRSRSLAPDYGERYHKRNETGDSGLGDEEANADKDN